MIPHSFSVQMSYAARGFVAGRAKKTASSFLSKIINPHNRQYHLFCQAVQCSSQHIKKKKNCFVILTDALALPNVLVPIKQVSQPRYKKITYLYDAIQ